MFGSILVRLNFFRQKRSNKCFFHLFPTSSETRLPESRQVKMRIVVSDNGYSKFLQGSQDDPKSVIQEIVIQVEAVNDMPYLSWVNLPPKDGPRQLPCPKSASSKI